MGSRNESKDGGGEGNWANANVWRLAFVAVTSHRTIPFPLTDSLRPHPIS